MAVLRNTVTQPGYVVRIKGEGMPQHNFSSEKGDLFVTIIVGFSHLRIEMLMNTTIR